MGGNGFMKKKLRSKKGFTLVELIVTIAILGMVAGMGVGIVGQALHNYSTAQVTSVEQETSLGIESFILDAARVASSVAEADSKTNDGKTVFYLELDAEGTLRTTRSEVEKIGDPAIETQLTYTGVQSVSLQVKKQKPVKTGADPSMCFIFMDYSIEMAEGYQLTGSVVLNNADVDYPMTAADTYVDAANKITISRDQHDKFIAIYK